MNQNPSYVPTANTHRYTPAAQTDITITWRKHGWVPPAATSPERYRQIRAELNAIA